MLFKNDKIVKPLIAFYCMCIYVLVLFIPNKSISAGNYPETIKNSDPKHEGFFISELASGNHHHFEKSNNNKDQVKSLVKNGSFQDFVDDKKSRDLQLIGTDDNYTNFSRKLLVRYRKADIIFPHHYFW